MIVQLGAQGVLLPEQREGERKGRGGSQLPGLIDQLTSVSFRVPVWREKAGSRDPGGVLSLACHRHSARHYT